MAAALQRLRPPLFQAAALQGNSSCIVEGTGDEHMAIQWKSDADQALVEAKKAKKPLLLDFTAAPM
jgi:hypothetical protein